MMKDLVSKVKQIKDTKTKRYIDLVNHQPVNLTFGDDGHTHICRIPCKNELSPVKLSFQYIRGLSQFNIFASQLCELPNKDNCELISFIDCMPRKMLI